jgi:hypothetical protein
MNQDTMLTLRRRAIGVAVASALAALCSGNAFADPVMTARLFRDTDILFRDADMSRWSDNYVELGVGNNTILCVRHNHVTKEHVCRARHGRLQPHRRCQPYPKNSLTSLSMAP